jgi:hypothetical protein
MAAFQVTQRMMGDALPEPEKEEKKELLIFAIYIEIGTQSETKARTRLREIHEMYGKTFKEIENQTNYLIKSFIFPIREGTTRMECIFSGNNTKPGAKNMDELLGSVMSGELNLGYDEAKGFTVGDKEDEDDYNHFAKQATGDGHTPWEMKAGGTADATTGYNGLKKERDKSYIGHIAERMSLYE